MKLFGRWIVKAANKPIRSISVWLLLGLLLFIGKQSYSQCTGCTITVNSNASAITVNPGDVVCMTFNNFNKSVTLNGGTLCIASGKTWASSTVTINGNCTIINNGTMTMAFTQNSYCTLQNYGTISGGFTQTGGSITNYSGGHFTPSSFSTTGGSFVNNSGGTATFPAAVSFPSGYSLTNNGTITIPGFTVKSGATVTLAGTTQTISGNVINDGTFSYTGTGSIGGTMSEGASAITNFTGTVTITSTFKDSGTVNLNGSLTVSGVYSDITGTQVNETGTGCNALTLSGGYFTNLGTFNGNNTAFQVTPAPFCTTCLINGAYAGSGTTPTHQPSSLSIALSNLTVNGSFSAASSGVNGYIVLRNVAPTAPANNNPVSGTAYTVGQSLGPWTVAAIITDATTGTKTFSDVVPTGQCGKNVYYNIYSFQGCGSTIKYNTTSPLNGSLALSNPSTANAGSAITQCNNSAFTLAGNNPAIGVGTWSLVSGTATIANTALNISGVTLAAGQTATLKWSINNGGCAASTSNVVLTNTLGSVSLTPTNVSCYGGANGSISTTPSGGTSPYTYLWSNSATTQNLTSLPAGTYQVTATDANTCTASASATITQPATALTDTSWSVDVTYYGGNNGYAYVTPSGGASPYTYHWSTGATSQNISGLVQGTYYVTITDANACTLNTAVGVGTPAQVTNGDIDPVTPNLITAPAGTYVIAMDNTLQQSGGLFNVKAYGLITTLLNNKIALNWVIKSGKAKDSLDFIGLVKPVFPTYSSTASSKSFYAGPFLIFPQDTTGNNIHTIVNTFNAANSSSPVYVYQLTTATTVDVRYVLTQIPKTAILNDGTNASIHVAYFTAASIPTSNYYVLSSATHLADSCYNFASEPHNDNPAGTVIDSIRSYVVNDGGNFLAECHAVWNYEDSTQGLFQSSAGINVVNTVVSPIVYGHPDLTFQQYQGAFDPTVTGGSVQNWVLNTGSSWVNNTAIYQSGSGANAGIVGQSVSKLGNGAGHLVFYTGGHAYGTNNANNINGMRSYFNAMLTPSNVVKCNFLRFDNDLAVTESISASNLYQSQRDTLKIVIVNNGPSQATANGVTVTDILPSSLSYVSYYTAKGSYNNATGTWTLGSMSLSEADTLNIIVSGSVAGAFTNTVFINKNLYDYYQSNDTANLSGTVYACSANAGPDVSQCGSSFTMAANSICTGTATWALISGSATITNLHAATTAVTVATGVTATLTWTFTSGSAFSVDTVVLTNYSATVPTVNNATINCAGNSVTLTATANTSYHWSTGATTQSISVSSGGTYTVTITNASGCTASANGTVTQIAALSASIAGTNINCYAALTGAANLTVTGGTTPYTYLWNNSATTQNLSGKAAGTYVVTVTDNNLCTATASATLTQPAAALSASISGTNINCYGASTGAANLTVSGGTTPYTYLWSNGANTQNLTGKAAGTYTVTVTDNKACTISSSKTLTQPAAALTSSVSGTNIACYGASTGAVAQTVSGGTSPYTYLWSNSATTQNLSGSAAGTYAVTVTDNNLCTATSSVTLTQPAAALSASVSGTNINCYGASTGAANLTVAGGTTPYSYHWSNGATTQNLSGKAAGTYTVTVTDNNACTITSSKTLTQPSAALSASIAGTNVSCYGGLTGAANLNVSGGTTPYTYHWSNSATTQNLAGIAAGIYTVTVTDQNACTTNSAATVTQPAAAWSATAGSNSPVCYLDNLNFTASPSGMSSYAWTGPESYTANTQNPTRSSLDTNSTGIYSVTITDSYGCAHSASVSATVLTGTAGLWIGSVSTDWNNPANWCAGVPTSSTNVTIPSATLYSPVISGNAYCSSLTLYNDSLTVLNTGVLNVSGSGFNNKGGKLYVNTGGQLLLKR